MELKQLLYFKAVADEGTISAAARKLNMSQPPLSSQMHLLEQELGCILFERGSRKIQLTEAGRIFYEKASTMLELAQITSQEMRDYRSGKAGTLRIGVVSSVGTLLLQKWIMPFHKKFPQFQYEIYEGNTYQILEQIKANLIEAALVRTPFSGEGVETVRLDREPMMAAGYPEFFCGIVPAAAESVQLNTPSSETAMKFSVGSSAGNARYRITLRDLSGKPLIVYRRWEQILTEQFACAGIQPLYFCKNDDARTTLEWAMTGMGIAIIPASAGETLIRRQKNAEDIGMLIYEIADPGLESDICAVYNPHAYLSMAARSLIEYMKNTGRQ